MNERERGERGREREGGRGRKGEREKDRERVRERMGRTRENKALDSQLYLLSLLH